MKYLLQVYQGSSREEFDRLSADEQQAIVEEYLAIRQSPGVIGGDQLQPVESATSPSARAPLRFVYGQLTWGS